MQRARAVLRDLATAEQAITRILAAAQRGDVAFIGLDPLHNAGKTLRRCLASLGAELAQLESWEAAAPTREAAARRAAAAAARKGTASPPGACADCRGTGRDSASDEHYYAPCLSCGGSGTSSTAPGSAIDVAVVDCAECGTENEIPGAALAQGAAWSCASCAAVNAGSRRGEL